MKRSFIAVLFCFFLAVPVFAEGDFLFSVYPHFTLPIGKENHNISYGIGAGGKFIYRPIDYFQFGVYGDYLNLNVPLIKSITVFDAGVTAGYVIPLGGRFNINLDVDAGLYRAIQNKTFNSFELGVSASFTYKIRPSVGIGTSASFAHFIATGTPLFNGMTVSPGATFNLTEMFNKKTNIIMDPKEILPVYPVLYSWYEKNRFGTVTVTNEEGATIDNVKVSFYQPQYMGHPKVCAGEKEKIKLASGKSIDVDLTAFFNERMLEMTEKSDTQAIVTVEYTCMGEKRSQDFSMIIPVYGRNSMSWADDRRAAVFVSSKDPAAMLYSKYVTSVVRENMRIGVPINIQYAPGIFDSLADFGINYVIDPSSAYTDNVGTETPDFLQFPYQTLSYRGGDCDDLSILMCSLLEAVGVDTAFITIPGHIYMAFNLGLNVNQATEQFGALDNFIVLEDEVWVPLEITVTNEGFDRAWQIGAREWRMADRNGTAAIYRMKDSWEIYKPVSVPGASVTFTMPEKNKIASIFSNGVDKWILREIEEKVDYYKKYIAQTGDIKAQNALGAIYGRYGLFDLASQQLASPIRRGYIPALLNSANVQFAKKNYSEAEKMYKNVITVDKNNAVAYIGVARCCYEQEKYNECDLAYQKAYELDKELSKNYGYLGSFENTKGRAYNLADRISYTVWVTEDILGLDNKSEQEIAKSFSEDSNDDSYIGLPNQISLQREKPKVTVEIPKATEEAPKPVEIPNIVEDQKTVEMPKIVQAPKVEETQKPVETQNATKKQKTPAKSKEIKSQKISLEPLPELPKRVAIPKIVQTTKEIKPQKIYVKPLPELPELNPAQKNIEESTQIIEEQSRVLRILEVPRLVETGYYIQLGVYKDVNNFASIYNKYKNFFALVGLEKGDSNVIYAGPFKEDEYIEILNIFKSFGFEDAFVKLFEN